MAEVSAAALPVMITKQTSTSSRPRIVYPVLTANWTKNKQRAGPLGGLPQSLSCCVNFVTGHDHETDQVRAAARIVYPVLRDNWTKNKQRVGPLGGLPQSFVVLCEFCDLNETFTAAIDLSR